MLWFGLTLNDDSATLRPKIDKRIKRPPLVLENKISTPALIQAFTVSKNISDSLILPCVPGMGVLTMWRVRVRL